MKKVSLVLLFFIVALTASAQYVVNVQVVDLQVSVIDKQNNFITNLKPEDFIVYEDNVQQQVLDLDLERQPFSIAVILDTSGSMETSFYVTKHATLDFLHSLRADDEFMLMTFDDKVKVKRDLGKASEWDSEQWKELHYGWGTRMYEALLDAMKRLHSARYPRRAIFLMSDGFNTAGIGDAGKVIETAQREKVLIYSVLMQDFFMDINVLRLISEKTGGTCFPTYDKYPRLQLLYQKIADDLAHRVTLYYRSTSDYSKARKPQIKVEMKNEDWKVRFQKAYFPEQQDSPQRHEDTKNH
jgi:Ca-activated chloride channel family protein